MEQQNNLEFEQRPQLNDHQPPQDFPKDSLSFKAKVLNFWIKKKKFIWTIFSIFLVSLIPIATLIASRAFEDKANIEEEKNGQEIQLSPTPSAQPTPTIDQKTLPPPSQTTTTPTTPIMPTPTPLPADAPTPIPTPTPTPISAPPDTAPPTFSQFSGPADGEVCNFNNFCFPMRLTDNAPGEIQVRHKFDEENWSDWGINFSPCYDNVENGIHQFSAQGKDAAGNETEVITRTFTIQKE